MRARLILLMLLSVTLGAADVPFVIHIVDTHTGRGVPLVELRAPNHRSWYTDSNGIAAITDPWLFGQDVFFEIHGHGYTFEERFFEVPGTKLHVQPGRRAELRIRRENIAERLYRVTGAGIYADSVLAAVPVPIKNPLLNGKVMGQDTVIAIPYRGRLYWFWGDTFGPANGNFNVAGATSQVWGSGGLDPDKGVDLTYFVDASGFAKEMLPIERPGTVWLEGLMTVRDPPGRERLVATYTRQGKLGAADERGVAVFDDRANVFHVLAQLRSTRGHRSSHPVRVQEGGRAWWYLYPSYRVPDDWSAIQNARSYESYMCDKADGTLRCAWKAGAEFVDASAERKLIEEGKLSPDAAAFPFLDAETGLPTNIEIGSIAWNAYRKKWIMIAGAWGDVYYSEASAPHGPWRCAKRIVGHDKYNFYNLVHHPFFDKDDGRVIYFEGTYTDAFMTGARTTPLYQYNQIMYKLALDDVRLGLPAPCSASGR